MIHSDLLIAFRMRRGTLLHSPGPRALAEFLIESSAECDGSAALFEMLGEYAPLLTPDLVNAGLVAIASRIAGHC